MVRALLNWRFDGSAALVVLPRLSLSLALVSLVSRNAHKVAGETGNGACANQS